MEIISIAKSIAGCIFPLARPYLEQEYGYFTSYNSNVTNLEIEVGKLKEGEQDILGNARRDHHAFQKWLKVVKDTIAQADELINEEVRCLNWPFPNVCLRIKLSKKAERMKETVSKKIEEGRSLMASHKALPPFAREYEALESRTSILNEIKQALKDPNINRIGVCGMGGVGKTKLMEELAWQVEKEGSFGVVVMARITKNQNLETIQVDLAEMLDLTFEKDRVKGRAGELRERIISEKSILVILDDIWGELDLAELGVPYGDDHKGCKLVLTSRDRSVVESKMNTQENFFLEVLSEEESRNLFETMAGDAVKQHSIKPIAVQVAECCAGLPLSIVTVAKSLRKKNKVWSWQDSLNKLKKLDRKESLIDEVYGRLKFSYNCLESEELKKLFLLIGCFELDGVNIEELFPICWGLGLYEVDTLEEGRNRHYALIDDLRASSLLLGRETEWVEMHGLVHDVAKLIASGTHPTYAVKRFTTIKEWPKIDQPEKCRFMIFPRCDINELPPKKMDCPELELLMLQNYSYRNYLNVPDNFFTEMSKVKVLYLSGMKLTKPPPPSLCRLTSLRSLDLSENVLEDIAIIGELKMLEILILEGVENLEELPKEIGHLTSLRLLNVNKCKKLRLIPKYLLSRLECLEELYMEDCPIEWEVEGSNNHNNIASLAELRNLDKLKALSLTIQDGSILPGDLLNFANLERYFISIGMDGREWSGSCFPSILMLGGSSTETFFSNVKIEALLSRVQGMKLWDLKYVNGDGFLEWRLVELRELHFLSVNDLTVDTGPAPLTLFVEKVAMPNLETMRLSWIYTSKIWDDNLAAHSCFQNLRSLDIRSCKMLTSLFPSSVARALVKLKLLQIQGCRKLKTIFAQEDISRVEVILPNLETLKISKKMNELEFLWPGHLAQNSYCKLKKMKISNCPKLLNVFPSYMLNNLHNLETLEVEQCKKLEDIFDIQEQSTVATNQQGGLATRLTTLTLHWLPNLKHIWSKDPHGILRFQNLCMVRVWGCKSLDYVFPFFVAEDLQQLQVLFIFDCGIDKIFEKSDSDEVKLVSLERLMVSYCHKLKNIVPTSMVFQNLNELRVGDCKKTVNIKAPAMATSLSKLRDLVVTGCHGIEEIVASKNDGDASSEIAFNELEELQLSLLPRLESFCGGKYSFKFPSLKTVIVEKCPMMKTFCNGNLTAPNLTSVTTARWKGVSRWEGEPGDLNTTIRRIFDEKYLRRSISPISEQGSSQSSPGYEDEGSCSNAQSFRRFTSPIFEQRSSLFLAEYEDEGSSSSSAENEDEGSSSSSSST